MGDGSSRNLGKQCLRWYIMLNTRIVLPYGSDLKKHHRHRYRHGWAGGEHETPSWNLFGSRVPHPSGKELRHLCLPYNPGAILSTQSSSVLFLERLKLPFSIDEILSGYKNTVSSGTDHFTTRVKTDLDATLVRHMVDVQEAVAEFREASERRHSASSQAYRLDKKVPHRSPVQKRLGTNNWNPGPRRGKEDAFEKQIAGKWHVITPQGSI